MFPYFFGILSFPEKCVVLSSERAWWCQSCFLKCCNIILKSFNCSLITAVFLTISFSSRFSVKLVVIVWTFKIPNLKAGFFVQVGPLKPDFLGAWKGVWLIGNPAYQYWFTLNYTRKREKNAILAKKIRVKRDSPVLLCFLLYTVYSSLVG